MKKINFYPVILILSILVLFITDSYATRYSIDVKNFEFSPSNLTSVRIGDTIHFEWKNGNHTTTSTTIPTGAATWDHLMDASHLTFDYIPTTLGVYHYKCTPHESMGMVGQFTVLNFTGIDENIQIPKITMYPNPIRDRVYLNCKVQEGTFIQHLTIYDVSGKIIRELLFTDNSSFPDYLDLSDIHEGLIIFKFIDNLNRPFILRAVRKD
jgi:plastocyanin